SKEKATERPFAGLVWKADPLFHSPSNTSLTPSPQQCCTVLSPGRLIKVILVLSISCSGQGVSVTNSVSDMLSQRSRTNTPNFLSSRSEEHTSELQSRENLVCRL